MILLTLIFLYIRFKCVFILKPKSLKNEIKNQHRVYFMLVTEINMKYIFLDKLSWEPSSAQLVSPGFASPGPTDVLSWRQTFIRNREMFYLWNKPMKILFLIFNLNKQFVNACRDMQTEPNIGFYMLWKFHLCSYSHYKHITYNIF